MSSEARTALVVGGAGYVGNVLVRRLLARGYGVRVLDRLIFDHGEAIASLLEDDRFEFVHGDLRDPATVDAALDEVTDVVLLAGLVGDPITKMYPELSDAINLDGCTTVLERLEAHGIDRMVFTSTCSNYGLRDTDEPATEEFGARPGVSLRAPEGRDRGAHPGAAWLGGPDPDGAPDRDRVRPLAEDAVRSDDLRVHGNDGIGRGARRLRRRHVASLLPRGRHLRRGDLGARGAGRAGCLRGLQHRAMPTRTTRSGWSSR